MTNNFDKEREERKELMRKLKEQLSKSINPSVQNLSKEFLDGYRQNIVMPKIKEAINLGTNALKTDNMTDFILSVSKIAQDTESFINNGCMNAESIDLTLQCMKDARRLRAETLNSLTESLVEKCGGKMTYIISD